MDSPPRGRGGWYYLHGLYRHTRPKGLTWRRTRCRSRPDKVSDSHTTAHPIYGSTLALALIQNNKVNSLCTTPSLSLVPSFLPSFIYMFLILLFLKYVRLSFFSVVKFCISCFLFVFLQTSIKGPKYFDFFIDAKNQRKAVNYRGGEESEI